MLLGIGLDIHAVASQVLSRSAAVDANNIILLNGAVFVAVFVGQLVLIKLRILRRSLHLLVSVSNPLG